VLPGGYAIAQAAPAARAECCHARSRGIGAARLAAIEGPFDCIVIADTIGMFEDIDGTLALVHHLCAPSTRIIIS
jgi:hypothetical protein